MVPKRDTAAALRVRIVEDTVPIATWLGEAVELNDSSITAVTTTADFTELLEPEPWESIDVALVDVMLGGMSGIDIMRYLRNDHPNIRIVCMTASLPSAQEVTGMADRVLIKPFDVKDLLLALRPGDV